MKPFPPPIYKFLLKTCGIGLCVNAIGVFFWIWQQDDTIFLLSTILSLLLMFRGYRIHHFLMTEAYECVEGVCTSIVSRPFGKYRKIFITDCQGEEITLFLPVYSKVTVGKHYRFYFSQADHLHLYGNYIDSILCTDYFLGYEEVNLSSRSK